MGDAQPISERVNRWQGLLESLPFLLDKYGGANPLLFIRIKDYVVININNMIPVPKGQLIELNINAEKNPHYKFLLQAESREINRQKSRIRKNAEIVYNHKKRNGNLTPLAKRTNDFEMLENHSRDFS